MKKSKMENKSSQVIMIRRCLLLFLIIAVNEIDFTESTQNESSRLTSNHLIEGIWSHCLNILGNLISYKKGVIKL